MRRLPACLPLIMLFGPFVLEWMCESKVLAFIHAIACFGITMCFTCNNLKNKRAQNKQRYIQTDILKLASFPGSTPQLFSHRVKKSRTASDKS